MHEKTGLFHCTGLIFCLILLATAFTISHHPGSLYARENVRPVKSSPTKPWRPAGQLTFLCYTGPGTAYDYLARQMLQVIPDYFGKRAIIRTVVGGSGGNALDTLYNSKPDGKTFLLYSVGTQVALMVEKRYKWDIKEIPVLFAVDAPPYGVYTSVKHSKYKSFKELMETKEVVRIALGGANLAVLPLVLQLEKNGIKYKVARFKDNQAAFLAVMAGDAEVTMSALSSISLDPIRAGDLRALWQFSNKRLPELPDVPALTELGMPAEWNSYNLIRLFAAPPGIPRDIQNALTDGLMKTLQDKRTVAWSKKAEIPVNIIKRNELEERLRVIEAGFKQNIEIVKRYFF